MCQSGIKGQGSALLLELTQLGHWGSGIFPRELCAQPYAHLFGAHQSPWDSWLGQLGGSLACRVLCMEPSGGFLGSQGAPHPICFWASVPSSVLSPLCNPRSLALTLQSLSL